MKVVKSDDKINELLSRGVDKIYPSKEKLEEVLRSGKKLKLYQGFDPTGTKLHIGHMVGLRKLAEWQALGHHVVFLIGDGTGQAGDPSGKTTAREKFHSRKELRHNAKDYVMQAKKIVKFDGKNPVEILYNGDWLNNLNLVDILNIAENFSLQQLSERDMYQERIKRGEMVNLREFLYPLLQGYDSVALDVDLELGGSDQTFNMLCGRTLMKSMKKKDKFVMTVPLLADSSGRKIGKTEGNTIALDDKPEELYGKIMAFPDDVIVKCFECLTLVPMEKVATIEKAISGGANPMIYKKELAFAIVSELNSEKKAEQAEKTFVNTFQKREIPEDVLVVPSSTPEISIVDYIVEAGLSKSKSDARRKIEQGGVELGGEKIMDHKKILSGKKDNRKILKVGKKDFIRIEF